MEGFLAQQGLLIKDFSKFVQKQSRRIAEHAERLAKNSGRPYLYLNGPHRKEAIVQGLIEAEDLRQGLVCVMRAVEPCRSFKLVPGQRRPRLVAARRKCLCFYFVNVNFPHSPKSSRKSPQRRCPKGRNKNGNHHVAHESICFNTPGYGGPRG